MRLWILISSHLHQTQHSSFEWRVAYVSDSDKHPLPFTNAVPDAHTTERRSHFYSILLLLLLCACWCRLVFESNAGTKRLIVICVCNSVLYFTYIHNSTCVGSSVECIKHFVVRNAHARTDAAKVFSTVFEMMSTMGLGTNAPRALTFR